MQAKKQKVEILVQLTLKYTGLTKNSQPIAEAQVSILKCRVIVCIAVQLRYNTILVQFCTQVHPFV